ncbi:MAG: MCE family protein [Bacteroidales bacterium]|nr:MCE family protein [Bacteroidales bacterium]
MKLSKEVKIGLTAILVLAIAIWGYNFLKGKNIFNPTEEYYVMFDRVDGLIESGNVMYKGYKIGNITGLEMQADAKQFKVSIIVSKDFKIPVNSVVQIKQTNPLASTADLEIVFSEEKKYHKPGDILKSEPPTSLMDYVAEYKVKIDGMLIVVDSILNSVEDVLNTENKDNIAAAIQSMNDAFGPDGELRATLGRLESITTNIDRQKGSINASLANLEKVTTDLDSTDISGAVDQLNATIVSINDIVAKIDSGDGSLGKLLNDPSVYQNLDSTTFYLNTLVKDLQENPKRYVHFSVFGGKDKKKD